MSNKRRRDFSEKPLGRTSDNSLLEREELERSKLKHADDYSNKRVEVSERFQEKVKEQSNRAGRREIDETAKSGGRKRQRNSDEVNKPSKDEISGYSKQDYKSEYSPDTEKKAVKNKTGERRNEANPIESTQNQKEKKAKQRNQQAKIQKEKEAQLETQTAVVQKSEYVLEIYDPLSKDMDNDGVIDRYDNDFRDSTISYEEKDRKLVQEKNYKRKNYKQEFHRSSKAQEPVLETKRTKNEELLKDLPDDRKIKNIQNKQRKDLSKVQDSKGNLKKKNSLALASTGAVLETTKRYLRKENDDNAGVDASEKSLGASSKLVHGIKDYRIKRQNKKVKAIRKYDDKILLRKSKLEFRDATKLSKAEESYQKMNAYRKFQKRKRIKASIYKQNDVGIKDRIKKAFIGAIKGTKELIKKKATKIGVILVSLFLFLSVILNAVSLLGGLGGVSGMILSSSYLTSDKEITVSDELLQELEADLIIKIQNIPTNYPGYDSYQYQVGSIGHDPQVLVAYLTAKYGEYRFSEVEGEIHELFKSMYQLKLEERVETYTVTETRTSTDPETGETTTEEVEVEKARRILITTLTSKRLEDVLDGRLNEEQQEHYEVLNETKGNLMNLHSPIQGEWKNKITSMYGYRADPFTGEKKFHTAIDIADVEGTLLLAVFDGVITYTEHSDSGYGNYVELTDKEGNMARYAHASSISSRVGQEVKKGDEIAKMGTTGNSTGSHLHFELYLADGTRVNPYFYLYSEEAFNSYTRPSVSSFNSFNWQGGDVQETVWGYLVTHGYTPEAAAGIMGNIEAESGFNTSAVESSVTNPGEGIGLIQWSFGRKAQLIAFAQSQGKPWSDIGVQIAFLDYEMNGAEGTVFPGGVNGFKNLTSIEEATSQFCWLFERPNVNYAHYERRISAAHAYYEMYKDFDASVVTP